MACVQLVPLCSTPVIATREGHTGKYAYLNLPGGGFWFASGQQLTFPRSQIPQHSSANFLGTQKPNTFTKGSQGFAYAACPVPVF